MVRSTDSDDDDLEAPPYSPLSVDESLDTECNQSIDEHETTPIDVDDEDSDGGSTAVDQVCVFISV